MLNDVDQKLTIEFLSELSLARSYAFNHHNHCLQTIFVNLSLIIQVTPNNGVYNQLLLCCREREESLEGITSKRS